MWRVPRSLKGSVEGIFNIQKAKYSNRPGNRKAYVFSGLAASAVGLSGIIVYGTYDPNFKKVLIDNVPFTKSIYQFLEPDSGKLFPGDSKKISKKDKEFSLLHQNREVLKEKETANKGVESKKIHPSGDESQPNSKGSNSISNSDASQSEPRLNKNQRESPSKKDEVVVSSEKELLEYLEELNKTSSETLEAMNLAVKSISHHTEKLIEAVDLSEGNDDDLVCKEAKEAASKKDEAVKRARQRYKQSKLMIKRIQEALYQLSSIDPNNDIVRTGTTCVDEFVMKLKQARIEVSAAKAGARTAAEYEQLVKASKEQFEKELKIVLPKLDNQDKRTNMSEDDLNVLITHAHRRIEKLQKEIAKLRIAEKFKIDEAMKIQKLHDEGLMEARITEELKKRNITLDGAVENKVSDLKAKLETDLHQQLLRQAAAHADHLEQALHIQAQELERKHLLDIEEKLLHEKGKFITEVSGNMLQIKGITEFLKAKSEFEMSTKKYQALSLLCQALEDKILQAKTSLPENENQRSLSKDVAAIKVIAKENLFINSLLNILSEDVVENGVTSRDALRCRFQNVKSVCKKVALIDADNDSLFRYFISYIQSMLVFDDFSGIKDEIKGLAAVDSSKFDNFDILNRVSYCLAHNDFNQGLKYAHLLQGEAYSVAEGWIKEVTFLLEAEFVVKTLTAHVSALRVQAYH